MVDVNIVEKTDNQGCKIVYSYFSFCPYIRDDGLGRLQINFRSINDHYNHKKGKSILFFGSLQNIRN